LNVLEPIAVIFSEHVMTDAERRAVGNREPIRRGIPEGLVDLFAVSNLGLFRGVCERILTTIASHLK
jgi:hypothetical protein